MALRLNLDTRPLWSGRTFWAGLLGILVIAGVLRFTGYNFSLPYVDHPDEPAFYLTALEWRGQFSINNYIGGYPPLYIWLQALSQIVLSPLGLDTLSEAVALFRLLSAIFSLFTLVLIALTAHRLAGNWAGWTAGMAWAVAPLVIQNGIYATPDPLLYLLIALALWLAIEAMHGRPWWAVWSVAAGCLAILDKYFVLTAVLPGIGTALATTWQNRRLGLKLLSVQAVMLAITALVAGVGILIAPREAAIARESGLANILNPTRVLNNMVHALLPLAPFAFVLYGMVGTAAWWVAPRFGAQRVRAACVLLVLLSAITIPWLAATFSIVGPSERMKDVLPATVGACVLLGVAVGQIALLAPPRQRWMAGAMSVLPLALLVWLPQTRDSWAIVKDRLLPDHRVVIRQWADAALKPGTVLVGRENEKTFNPYWGGIPYVHWFDWWETGSPLDMSVEQWRTEHGISYAAIEQSLWEALDQTADGRAWRDAVFPLRTFSGPARGPEMTFVRLWRPQVEESAQFGDAIRLVGYDLSAQEAAPGDTVTLTFYWNALAPPAANYSLFVHLVPESGDGIPVAQADGAPASPGRPTLLWTDSSETIISDLFALTVPAGLAPGTYAIRIGLYDPETGARLPVANTGGQEAGDSWTLGTLSVEPAP